MDRPAGEGEVSLRHDFQPRVLIHSPSICLPLPHDAPPPPRPYKGRVIMGAGEAYSHGKVLMVIQQPWPSAPLGASALGERWK